MIAFLIITLFFIMLTLMLAPVMLSSEMTRSEEDDE